MLPPELTRLPLTDKARYVGDPIAAVVAESRAAAVDAAELVDVDYDPLPAVTDPFEALEPDAPVVIEAHGSNRAIEFTSAAEPGAMVGHDMVVTGRFVNHRMSGAPIEPSAVLAAPGGGDGVTLWCTTQRPHEVRDVVAAALDAPADQVRVIAPAVGGGFGSKAVVYPEFVATAWLARHLGRPVKWVETRSENLVNMSQGRDHIHDVELGVGADGTFRWLRIGVTANVGAYPAIGAFLPYFTMLMASGPYRIPAVHYEAVAVITNTTPVAAFRGAGRPEATVTLERIVDLAAAEIGIDPAELRRRNLLAPTDFPLTTPTGANMDCGEYGRALELALETAGYEELRAEQARRRAAGSRRLLGIGVSAYVEITAVGLFQEFGSVKVELDGTITARVGTASHGQGHATAFSQVLGEVLGVPADQVKVIHSDTAEVPRGTGTVASRSLQIGGSALFTAANEVLDTARRLAASLLEADAGDIVVAPGGLAVAGVPARTVSWADLAAAAAADEGPEGSGRGDWPRRPTSTRASPATRSGPMCRWWRSTPTPETQEFCAMSRWTTVAGSSTHCWCRDRSTEGWPPGSHRPCTRRRPTTNTAIPATRTSPTTPSRPLRSCPDSRRPTPRRRRRSTRSAPRASASRAPSGPPRPCRPPCSTRWRPWASTTWTCPSRPSGSGGR